MNKRILIVDDERDLVSTLQYNLENEGYVVDSAFDGENALRIATRKPQPDLVLLDLMLPDIPGTEVCRRLRAQESSRSLPVVFLTAKGEEIDRVVGFELGADDYVVKPFSIRELTLRIRAVLRRNENPSTQRVDEILRAGNLEMDLAAHRVEIAGNPVQLTALEFKLLKTLVAQRGRVQTREELLDRVWGIRADITTRTVDTHVKRLRHKLGEMGETIETLRGVGYRFRSAVIEQAV